MGNKQKAKASKDARPREEKFEFNELKTKAQEQTATYLMAAFGFVAGLAWNEAIKSLIDIFFPLDKNTVIVKFIYAGLVTLILVIVSVYLARLAGKKK